MNITDFIATIRGYTGFNDPSVITDTLITSWVRMGEELCSASLRIADMVQIDTALITEARVLAPTDWLSTDFVRIPDEVVFNYESRTNFYTIADNTGFYTESGRYIIFGGTPDTVNGKTVELHYFGEVPVLNDDGSSWLAEKHLSVFIDATMNFAQDRLVDNTIDWGGRFGSKVEKLNDNYLAAKGRGGMIARRARSFG